MGEARARIDLIFGLLLTAVGQWEFWWSGEIDHPPSVSKRAVAAVCVAATTAALARRRRDSIPCVFVAAAAVALAGGGIMSIDLVSVTIAQLVLVYSAAVYAPTRPAAAALVATIASTVPEASDAADLAFFGALALGAFAAGVVVRRQRILGLRLAATNALLTEERAHSQRLAADAERLRIARDLHDVVAHSLGGIVVQAELADDSMSRDPVAARAAVAAISDTARGSLTEVRRILGALRDSPHVAPTLTELPELIDFYRAAGLSVDCAVEGLDAEMPQQVASTAYLVTREALTNVLRHADGAPARVGIDVVDNALVVEVRDEGPGDRRCGNGDGHGLVGIRERVGLAGGTSEIGNAADGGFRVRVTLPLETVVR